MSLFHGLIHFVFVFDLQMYRVANAAIDPGIDWITPEYAWTHTHMCACTHSLTTLVHTDTPDLAPESYPVLPGAYTHYAFSAKQ